MMEITGGAIIESEEGEGYPFADLSRLRTDAGAFMRHVLSEDEDDEMDCDSQRIITPDYPWFTSEDAPLPPQDANDVISDRPVPMPEGIFRETKGNPSSLWNSFFGASHPEPITSSTAHYPSSHVEVRIIPTSQDHCKASYSMTSTSRANPSRQWTSPLKKSKSIQIKSNRRRGSDEFSSSSVSASAEQMYDWATWRMYHRITTARRTKASVKPLPAGSTSHQDTVSSSRAFRGVSGFPRQDGDHLSIGDTDVSPQKGSSSSAEKSDFDEGVFVMDL